MTAYEIELTERFLNKQVKPSEYALRSLRDAWLACGEYSRKMSYRRQYDAKRAERGTVIAILEEDHDRGVASGLHVQWDRRLHRFHSTCLPYMVEVA